MKLLIAIPSHDDMPVGFVKCLRLLEKRLRDDGIDYDVFINEGTLVYVARDKLALHAIKYEFTHVLWLDSDMIFNDDLLDDLMFSGKDFVTGICHARRKPYNSCVFKDLKNVERYDDYPNTLFKIAGCGFACVLMKTSLLIEVQQHFGTCFCPTKELGEDVAFCSRLSYLNHEMYCDPSVVLGHIAHVTIYPEDHRKYMAELEANKCS